MENPPFSTENRRNFIYRKTFFSNLLFQSSVVQLENKPIGSQLLMRTGKVLDASCLEHEGFQRNPCFFLLEGSGGCLFMLMIVSSSSNLLIVYESLGFAAFLRPGKKRPPNGMSRFCGQLADPKLVYNTVG